MASFGAGLFRFFRPWDWPAGPAFYRGRVCRLSRGSWGCRPGAHDEAWTHRLSLLAAWKLVVSAFAGSFLPTATGAPARIDWPAAKSNRKNPIEITPRAFSFGGRKKSADPMCDGGRGRRPLPGGPHSPGGVHSARRAPGFRNGMFSQARAAPLNSRESQSRAFVPRGVSRSSPANRTCRTHLAPRNPPAGLQPTGRPRGTCSGIRPARG